MKKKTKRTLLAALIVIALLLTVPAWFAYRLGIIPRIDHTQTFHAPVFGPDGRKVYYLSRNAWGISWGPGIEFFTPPASVLVISDWFLLQSTRLDTGEETTVHSWRVNHAFKPKTQYRNYLFGIPECELKWQGRTLQYKIGLDFLANDPADLTVNEWTVGSWNVDSTNIIESDNWKSGYHSIDRWTEQILSGPFEIIDYKSLALILYDSGTETRKPLRVSSSFGWELREQVAKADLKDYTHRAQLERSRTIRETYAGTVAGLRARGLPEGEAMLQANDEMEKMGYYPKTPRLVAKKLENIQRGIAIFSITSDEFRFGLFQDIEKAIATPGAEVHFWGNYITHRDFETSRKLNEHLAAGNKTFIIKTEKEMFLISIN